MSPTGLLCGDEGGTGTARTVRSKSDRNTGADVSDRLPKALSAKTASGAMEHTRQRNTIGVGVRTCIRRRICEQAQGTTGYHQRCHKLQECKVHGLSRFFSRRQSLQRQEEIVSGISDYGYLSLFFSHHCCQTFTFSLRGGLSTIWRNAQIANHDGGCCRISFVRNLISCGL